MVKVRKVKKQSGPTETVDVAPKNSAVPNVEVVQTNRKTKKVKSKSKRKANREEVQRRDEKLYQENALNYLKKWKENRRKWKFEKLKQIWLLKNPFDSSRIPDIDFETFVEYIAGARGKAREQVEQRAVKIVEAMEKQQMLASGVSEAELIQEHPILRVDDSSYQRARTLLQNFQDSNK